MKNITTTPGAILAIVVLLLMNVDTQAQDATAISFSEEAFLDNLLRKYGKIVIIIDGSKYHFEKEHVQKFYEENKDYLKVVQLSAYSPELNPIEQVWKKTKKWLSIAIWGTKEEFKSGHLEKAINIPYTEIEEQIKSITKDNHKNIVVYCRSGRRSGIAKKTLMQMGYKNVVNGGGYKDLLKQEEQ